MENSFVRTPVQRHPWVELEIEKIAELRTNTCSCTQVKKGPRMSPISCRDWTRMEKSRFFFTWHLKFLAQGTSVIKNTAELKVNGTDSTITWFAFHFWNNFTQVLDEIYCLAFPWHTVHNFLHFKTFNCNPHTKYIHAYHVTSITCFYSWNVSILLRYHKWPTDFRSTANCLTK